MPQYDLHVLCSECGKFHDVLLRLSLEQSFEVRNVRDLYNGAVPPEFYAAIAEQECPVTRKPFRKPNPDLMVLVVVGGWFSTQF